MTHGFTAHHSTIFLIGAALLLLQPAHARAATPCPAVSALATAHAAPLQYAVAQAYATGTCGFARDKEKAVTWYEKAAKQGDMLAEYALGEVYFTGNGAARDFPKAKAWFLKAARQGHGPSALRLGYLYAEAHYTGVTVDDTQAERWFTVAAKQNIGDARFRLGTFYMDYKRPPDYARGRHWLELAAQGADANAMFDLGRFLLSPPAAAHMKAEPQAGVSWLTKAAKTGLLPAQITLAGMYDKGKGVPRDPAKARRWVMTIARSPVAPVYYLTRAGDMLFENKDGTPRDYAAARAYYLRAAARGDAHALTRLSEIYAQGLGVQADSQKAAAYAARAKQAAP